MTKEIRVTRADLMRALVKRAAVSVVEGEGPAVQACAWCGKLIARKPSRRKMIPRFCRAVPPKRTSLCASRWNLREEQRAASWAAREDWLVGPSGSVEDFIEWAREVGGH